LVRITMRLRCALILYVALLAPACAPARSSVAATPVVTAAATAPTAAVRAATPGPLDGVLASVQPDPSQDYGVFIEDLASGSQLALNADRIFPAASVYKLALAWEVLRRIDRAELSLDMPLEIVDEDATEAEPYGGFAPGEIPTVDEALDAMMSVSSNASAHALLRTIGRREFNASLAQSGLAQTSVPEVPDGGDAVTSAQDIALLLRLIAQSQGLSESSQSRLRSLMAAPQWPDALRDTLPDEVRILDKIGNLDDASNVGALLSTDRGTVLLVVLDQGVDPGDARGVITQLGRAAYTAFLEDKE
jgi:beta-lactamase class A